MTMVRGLAEKEHSAALDQFISSISAIMKLGDRTDESPFSKVKSLISDRTLKTTEKKENLESDVANMKFDAGAGEDPIAECEGFDHRIDQPVAEGSSRCRHWEALIHT